MAKAFLEAEAAAVPAAIIDVRAVEGMPKDMERFEIATFIADHRAKHIRLAMVSKPDVARPARFSEDVAANRGAQFRAFTDFDVALSWLAERDE